MVGNGIFMSKLIYLIPLWGGTTGQILRMLQTVQNRAARCITKNGPYTSTKNLLAQCNWMSVEQLVAYHSIIAVHKILCLKKPKYLYDNLRSSYPRCTRLASSGAIRMDEKFTADLSLTQSSFRWRGSHLYNEIPAELRMETNISKFKARLKIWIKGSIHV